jgi:membrane-associated phospholipid phosphatase
MTNAGSSATVAEPMASEETSLRWPSRLLLIVFLREAAWVSLLWLFVYGGANWLTGMHDYRVRLWTSAELSIPFVPATATIYLSLFPLMWMAPFVLHTPAKLREFSRALGWLIVFSGVGFLLLPADQVYETCAPTGITGSLFACADRMNMDYNFCPSLHVGFAAASALVYGSNVSRLAATCIGIWAIAIAASTLLLHQHYVVDVVAGGLLAFLVILFQDVGMRRKATVAARTRR